MVCWWCCVRSWCVGGAACGLKKSTDTDRCLLLPRYVRILPCLVNLLGYVLPLMFVLYVAGNCVRAPIVQRQRMRWRRMWGGRERESEREKELTRRSRRYSLSRGSSHPMLVVEVGIILVGASLYLSVRKPHVPKHHANYTQTAN